LQCLRAARAEILDRDVETFFLEEALGLSDGKRE